MRSSPRKTTILLRFCTGFTLSDLFKYLNNHLFLNTFNAHCGFLHPPTPQTPHAAFSYDESCASVSEACHYLARWDSEHVA